MPRETTGTLIRPPHMVAGPALTFDLAGETAQLRNEAAKVAADRHTKTLIKEADFSVVLMAMEEGAVVQQHTVPAEVALHMLNGHVRLETPVKQFDLLAGELVVLDRGVPFRLEAQRSSSFLLTVARHALEELSTLSGYAEAVVSADHAVTRDAEIVRVTHRYLERRTPFLELTFRAGSDTYLQRWIGESAARFLEQWQIVNPQALEGKRCRIQVIGHAAEFMSLTS